MLSLMSTLTSDQWFERIAQPAAGMELMRQYPLVRANAKQHRRAFANGQFMMFTRAAYEKMGGHEAVKGAVLEDVELARLAERRGVAGGLFLADGMLHCRMYANTKEFVHGWKRIYIEAANRRVKRLREVSMRGMVVGALLPPLGIAAVVVPLLIGLREPLVMATLICGVFGLAVLLFALAWAYRISRVPIVWALLYPIGAWQVALILRAAAKDLEDGVPVRWGGREYVREAR
jgi:chlorobactene glucosyltransferase